jgi:hypothetical protein
MGILPHKRAARSGGGLGVKTPIQRKNTLRQNSKNQLAKSILFVKIVGQNENVTNQMRNARIGRLFLLKKDFCSPKASLILAACGSVFYTRL